MASVAERRAWAPAERQAPERAMSQVLIAIVDDDEPVRDATKTFVRSDGLAWSGPDLGNSPGRGGRPSLELPPESR